MDVRKKFDDDMLKIYYNVKMDTGYDARQYYKMIYDGDALKVAKKIIAELPLTDGYTNIFIERNPEHCVEALALKPEYQQLFTYKELELCKIKLGLI